MTGERVAYSARLAGRLPSTRTTHTFPSTAAVCSRTSGDPAPTSAKRAPTEATLLPWRTISGSRCVRKLREVAAK